MSVWEFNSGYNYLQLFGTVNEKEILNQNASMSHSRSNDKDSEQVYMFRCQILQSYFRYKGLKAKTRNLIKEN